MSTETPVPATGPWADQPVPHLTPEQFREHGHAVVDWIADYWGRVEQYPVASRLAPGDVVAGLPASPPQQPEAMADVLADLDGLLPGLMHWQHPGFFGYFPANSSPAAILGDLVSSGLGVNGMLWATSPAATELELRVLDWLAQLLDLPAWTRAPEVGAVIEDSASSATLCALLAARRRAVDAGADPSRLTVYTSGQAHSSVEKALMVAGFAPDRLRLVQVDEVFAADPAHLRALVQDDQGAGLTPCLVVACVGTTGTTAIDPVRAIAGVLHELAPTAWLHVDAAYAGVAAVCPELRSMHDGLELVDSYVTNPHKWLLTTFDCTAFWVRRADELTAALSVLPEYLRTSATGAAPDLRDRQVPLGRRFRALKLWFVLRSYGASGLQAYIRNHVAWAGEVAALAEAHPGWDVVAPAPLSTVVLRPAPRPGEDAADTDARCQQVMDAVNAEGSAFVSHTRLPDGRLVLRVAVGAWTTRREHVTALWQRLAALVNEG